MKRILSLFLALVMALGFAALVPPGAQAEEVTEIDLATVSIGVAYINANGKYRITGTAPKNGGIMVSPGVVAQITLEDVTIEEAAPDFAAFELEVKAGTGTPHTGVQVFLTLIGTNKLKGSSGRAGLAVPAGANLTITADSTGSLEAIGVDNGAGIGGGCSDRPDFGKSIVDAGTITINGGTITATAQGSQSAAAGIGGGSDGAGGTVIITGGTVTATGGSATSGRGGAGIGGGGGNLAGASGAISIRGGEVTAIAGGNAMAIGASYGATPPAGALGLGTVGSITFGGLYHYWTNTWTAAPGEKTGGGAFANDAGFRYVRLEADNEPPVMDLEAVDLKPDPGGKLDFTGTTHNMNITFNEEMKTDAGTVTLKGADVELLGWSDGDKRREVQLKDLANGMLYELEISGFQDFVGNTMEPVKYNFTTAIKDVPVLIPTPMTGEAPGAATTTAENFDCSEVTWAPAVEGDAFGSGVEYTATVTVTPIDGYEFTTLEVNATINGHSAVKESAETEITLSYKFPPTLIPVSTAALTVTAPLTDEEPDAEATGTGNFEIGAVTWEPNDDPFAVGKEYTAAVTLTAKEGYAFTDDFTATINGDGAAVTHNQDGTVTVSYVFPTTTPPGTIAGTISLTDGVSGRAHMNLAAETVALPDDFTVAAYSVDGGDKWKKGALPAGAAFSKLFNKDLTLWVADKWNDSAVKDGKTVVEPKGVAKDAAIVKFPKISKRPAAEKVMAWYGADDETKWVLSKKGKTFVTPDSDFEYAPTSNGKDPSGDWEDMPAEGIDIPAAKTTWLVRVKAVADESEGTYTPASKIVKLKVNPFGKVPKYKAPTAAKPLLKLKKGDLVTFDGAANPLGSATAKLDITIVHTVTDPTKEIAGGTSVTIWKAATGKKPASLPQTLAMPEIAAPAATGE